MDDHVASPESLLPYPRWTEEALRAVAVDALEHVAEHGLPGDHHFYLSFRTDHAGAALPASLKARYPTEMTIVLQHRFWDLKVNRAAGRFSVGLSFGGMPATLVVPFAALTAFADPTAKFGLRFGGGSPPPAEEEVAAAPAPVEVARDETPQVVSLDAFRRRTPKD